MSETAMMMANRYHLRHLDKEGHRGARMALAQLDRTDKPLGAILLFNNLVNSAAAMLVSIITIAFFGGDKCALGASTLAVIFTILEFFEAAPKVIGATFANRLAIFSPRTDAAAVHCLPRCLVR